MSKVILENSISKLSLNLDQGGQIETLFLVNPKSKESISVILPFDETKDFFLSGNFLMYPWVNRLESNKIQVFNKSRSIEPILKDSNNFPIHGLYFNKARNLIELKKNFAKIEPFQIDTFFPNFTESFYLTDNSITIRTEFRNTSNAKQVFAYGYHPYLTLNTDIDNCFIQTNLSSYIPLTSESLPNSKLEKRKLSELFSKEQSIGNLTLDHLLIGDKKEAFFGIFDPIQNITLQIRTSKNSQISLPYFQIYTPENRKAIAIEPMTSSGNAFFIPNSGLYNLEPGESKFGEFVIEIK